jgi:hypothetical protein
MSEDTEQVRQNTKVCDFFCLQLTLFNDGSIRMVLLKTIPSYGKTIGAGIFQSGYASLLYMNVPIHKLGSVTTDGAPAMTSENVIRLCLRARSQDIFCRHCVINQHAASTKVIDFFNIW